VLIENTVEYHRKMSHARAASLASRAAAYTPFISVIMRCGSRPVDFIERAVRSISAQTYGEFELILVRHHDLDLSPVLNAPHPRIRSVRVVECPGGNRSASMCAGLRAVRGDYFAVLDDDDWWFSNH